MKYLKLVLLPFIAFSMLMSVSNAQVDSNISIVTMKGQQVGVAWNYSYGSLASYTYL